MISSLAICSDSNSRYDLAPPPDTEQVWVTGDIGDTVLVTGTSDGEVIVRNKVTYGAFYRAAHHGDTPIMALKVARSMCFGTVIFKKVNISRWCQEESWW